MQKYERNMKTSRISREFSECQKGLAGRFFLISTMRCCFDEKIPVYQQLTAGSDVFVIQADIIQVLLVFVPRDFNPLRLFTGRTNLGIARVPVRGILTDWFHYEEQLLDACARAEEQDEEKEDGQRIPDLLACGARQE